MNYIILNHTQNTHSEHSVYPKNLLNVLEEQKDNHSVIFTKSNPKDVLKRLSRLPEKRLIKHLKQSN